MADKYDKEQTDEAKRRFEDCRAQKEPIRAYLEEAYWFTAPQRRRQQTTESASSTRTSPGDECDIELPQELVTDFATYVLQSFLNDNEQWVRRMLRLAGIPARGDEVIAARQELATDDQAIFDEIKASNFYEEVGKGFVPDIGLGTVGLHIDHGPLDGPPVCRAVPIREIEINIGPDGSIDDRFIVRRTRYNRLSAVLPGVELPEKIAKKVKDSNRAECLVKWGWWRLWDRRDAETWQSVILVDDCLVEMGSVSGPGSCPFIVGRFGAAPEDAFGWGPTLQCLPGLRYLDELRAQTIRGIDLTVAPPTRIPDNGFAEGAEFDGFEPGGVYPMRPGSSDDIGPIFDKPDLDPAFFDEERCERRMKRMHFIDKPEQRGDTPPTAAQWMSEIELGQRRFGVPGRVFWREFVGPCFQRFARIMEDKGQIKPPLLGGKSVAVSAVNPAARAQDMQEVTNAARVLEIGMNAFPEEGKAAFDGTSILRNLNEKLKNGIIEFRDPAEVQQAVELISQLMGGQTGGVDAASGAVNPAGILAAAGQ
jgi:hypothetical protein